MQKRTSVLFPLILVTSLCLSSASLAEEQPLKVALSGNYMPLHGTQPSGSMFGFEAELAMAIGRQLGRKVEFVNTRRKFKLGTIDAVAKGKVDLGLNSITPTPERAKKVDFSTPYIELSYRLAGIKKKVSNRDLGTFSGKIAAPSKMVRQAISQSIRNATIVDCKNLRAGISMVKEGKVDLVAYEDVGLFIGVSDEALVVADATFGKSQLAIATPKGKVGPINAALEKRRNTLVQLKRKWKPGSYYLSEQSETILGRLPEKYYDLKEHNGKLKRVAGYSPNSPGWYIKSDETGYWQLVFPDIQDTELCKIHNVVKTDRRAYRLKCVDDYRSAKMLELKKHSSKGVWELKGTNRYSTLYVSAGYKRRYPVHDFD